MDRLDEWRLFLAVATHKNFAKAALELGKAPQAATRAIAALEARLGTRLFHRTTRSVTLTDDGERMREQARRALAEVELLESAAPKDVLRGVVTITAPVLFGQMHVLPIVTELLSKHPALDARLMLLDRVVSLAEEGVDVAVRIGELPDSSLRARLVGHLHYVLCASPAYLAHAGKPRTPGALSKHACIAFSATTPTPDRWLVDRERVSVRPRLTTSSGPAAIDAALGGLGIVRAVSYQVAGHLRAGRLVPLLERADSAPIPVHIVQLPGAPSRAATAFIDLAYRRLQRLLLKTA